MSAIPPILTITDRAAERIKEIIANADKPLLGLKVGIKKGGCAGMEYSMEMVEAPTDDADIVRTKDVTLFVEKSAMLFLLGTEMDFETSTLSNGFVFNNPNQSSACGCGISVDITPATPERLAQYQREV